MIMNLDHELDLLLCPRCGRGDECDKASNLIEEMEDIEIVTFHWKNDETSETKENLRGYLDHFVTLVSYFKNKDVTSFCIEESHLSHSLPDQNKEMVNPCEGEYEFA